MMNIYDVAMKMELEGKAKYQKMLEQTTFGGLKTILKRLIDMEENHYKIFESMKEGSVAVDVDDLSVDSIIEILNDSAQYASEIADRSEEVKLYEEALQLEKDSSQKYLELAENAASPEEKVAFEDIAKEEAKHELVLQNIIEFINDPEFYMDDAEFNPVDY